MKKIKQHFIIIVFNYNTLNLKTMKKSNFIMATLLVAVAASVAFVSCKKESQDTLLNNNQPVKAFTVPQVDDMNAYLKEFKQKMMANQRPVHWGIGYDCFINQGDKWHTFYHVVKVTFAILVTSDRGM